MLAWLSVWSKVQTCIWPSWCHCHSLSLASVKSRLVLPFWYWLTWVFPEKGQLNGCVFRFLLIFIAVITVTFPYSLPVAFWQIKTKVMMSRGCVLCVSGDRLMTQNCCAARCSMAWNQSGCSAVHRPTVQPSSSTARFLSSNHSLKHVRCRRSKTPHHNCAFLHRRC